MIQNINGKNYVAEPLRFRHILLQLILQMLLSTPEEGAENCENKDFRRKRI